MLASEMTTIVFSSIDALKTSSLSLIYSQALGLRDILARQEKLSQSVVLQPTSVYWLYYLLWTQQIVIFMQKNCAVCCGNHQTQSPIAIQAINLSAGYQVGITRELNKESLLNCYPIYIIYTWSMLLNNYPTLKPMCHP